MVAIAVSNDLPRSGEQAHEIKEESKCSLLELSKTLLKVINISINTCIKTNNQSPALIHAVEKKYLID